MEKNKVVLLATNYDEIVTFKNICEDLYDVAYFVDDSEIFDMPIDYHFVAITDNYLDQFNSDRIKEFLKALSKNNVGVLLITNFEERDRYSDFYLYGISDLLYRPLQSNILRHRINSILLSSMKEERIINSVYKRIVAHDTFARFANLIYSSATDKRNDDGLANIRMSKLIQILLEDICNDKDSNVFYPHAEIDYIRTGSYIQDIGRVFIHNPSKLRVRGHEMVFNSPGLIKDDDIHEHTIVGYEFLRGLNIDNDIEHQRLFEICRDIVLYHHERFDGSGYPYGLMKEHIPFEAQIVGFADFFEENLCIDKKLDFENVNAKIIENKNKFSPVIINSYLRTCDFIEKELKRITESVDKSEKEALIKRIDKQKEQFLVGGNTEETLSSQDMLVGYMTLSNDIYFEFDTQTRIVVFTRYGAKKLKLSRTSYTFEELIEMQDDNARELIAGSFEEIKKLKTKDDNFKKEIPIKVGNINCWYLMMVRILDEKEEDHSKYIGKMVNIDNDRKKIQTLETLSYKDGLTGLLNQRAAHRSFSDLLEASKNNKKHYALYLIDLDNFKDANDKYGHLFGNKVLQFVAKKMKEAASKDDIIARIGGDEFMACFEFTDLEDLKAKCKKYQDTISQKVESFNVSASIGVTINGKDNYKYKQLFSEADKALYKSKSDGKNTITYYDNEFSRLENND